ncbi:MAG: DNA-formamidopyrimidine glycosylase [Acholeplasmatales bacterium]|nr:DNA-formamidopyrimidine glycosylase [Acholeplasmatales bacterium]
MPELPEVETVIRTLRPNLIGLKIVDIDIRYNAIIDGDIDEFKNNIIGREIKDINRLGKFIIFNLDLGNIVSHLRMEGKYYYLPNEEVSDKHIHVIYYLSNGYMLCYKDVRKFGRMVFKNNNDLYTTKPLNNVGIDLILTKKFEIKTIYDKIINSPLPIKTKLLDQGLLSGLGNIYVDEVLFAAKINPKRLCNTISINELEIIIEEAVRILNKAIEYKGTTIRSYTSSLGVMGEYQNHLLIHTKKICPICNSKIKKDKVMGRGTYYCENCQR